MAKRSKVYISHSTEGSQHGGREKAQRGAEVEVEVLAVITHPARPPRLAAAQHDPPQATRKRRNRTVEEKEGRRRGREERKTKAVGE